MQSGHFQVTGAITPGLLIELNRTHDEQSAARNSVQAIRPQPTLTEINTALPVASSVLGVDQCAIGGFLVTLEQGV